MRRLLVVVLILALVAMAGAQQVEVEQAKSTEVTGFPYTNIGKVFDEYFMKPQWQMFIDNTGNKTIVFKGAFQGNPYAVYMGSDTFKSLPDNRMAALVKSLYNVAYDFGFRSDRIYGADDLKARQILTYLDDKVYKPDSQIEVYFQLLPETNTWWIREYSCDTCPSQNVNELLGLVLDGRFAGSLDQLKDYKPVLIATAKPASSIAKPASSNTEKRIASNTTKIAQFASLEGEVAYFDTGRGAQAFTLPSRLISKAQALKAGGMATITYDTIERSKEMEYIITDIK